MRGNFITDRSGELNPNYKDGRKSTRLYRIYNNMKSRCYNKNLAVYHRYGGRGIIVCEEWRTDFDLFRDWALANGYSDELTLDRENNDGNYEPSNCRWVTRKQQGLNRCTNHIVTLFGSSKPLGEWCELYSISCKTVRDRLKRGWDYYSAITTPVKRSVS